MNNKLKLQELLKEEEKKLEVLREQSPERRQERAIKKLQDKIKKNERTTLQGQIKANKAMISKALKSGQQLKDKKDSLIEEMEGLEEEMKANRIKQGEAGAKAAELTIKLQNFDSPVKMRNRDTGIYEETVE